MNQEARLPSAAAGAVVFTHSPVSWRRATYEPLVRAAMLCGAGPPLALAGRVPSATVTPDDLLAARAMLLSGVDVIDLALTHVAEPSRAAG